MWFESYPASWFSPCGLDGLPVPGKKQIVVFLLNISVAHSNASVQDGCQVPVYEGET